jgi:hypothetical protein
VLIQQFCVITLIWHTLYLRQEELQLLSKLNNTHQDEIQQYPIDTSLNAPLAIHSFFQID